MVKKAFTGLMAMTLGVVALTGCGVSKDSGSTSEASKSPAASTVVSPAASKADKVTINFMHSWPAGSFKQQNAVLTRIIDDYQKANPNVTVKTEVLENEQYKSKLKVLSASNQLPDVGFTFAAGFLEPYVKGDLFEPLDDVLNNKLKDKFVSGTTEAYAVNGKTYGLPVELNIVPVYYNKAIFAKNNLQVPKSYDEFLNVVKTLSNNNVVPIALGNKDRWTGSLWYMYMANRVGGNDPLKKAIARTGSFEEPSLIQAAKDVQGLVDLNAFNKGFNGLSYDEGKSEFMNGKAAMYLMGTWELPSFTTNPDVPKEFKDNVGFFKFPAVNGGKGDINSWVGGPGAGLFVAKNSTVKAEAKKFVEYFVDQWGKVAVTEAGVIPATKVDTGTVKLPQLYIDLLNELNNASNITLFADVQMKPSAAETHLNMIQALFGKAVSPEEFAKKHEEALDKAAKE
ncbi:extracellular solute-binding protein [Paenibacillus phytorum]|uniref:extracellular solute-binding protein n=1 Tax=Paenibacillus phytorum TaxID=2654977 RepID=UPI0028A87797|nr:extracellular solute-binding protein [Paenibacillus phytorum]